MKTEMRKMRSRLLRRLCVKPVKPGLPVAFRLLLRSVLPIILAASTAVAQPPTVTVDGPIQITSTTALIGGTINPNGLPTGFFVRWGTTTAYGQASGFSVVPVPDAETNVIAWMTGLSPNTTYHYQLVATNSAGNGYSADMTLTTAAGPPTQAPTVTTGSATAITSTNSTITGIVGTSGLPTTYYFRWGTTVAYGNTTPLGLLSANGSFLVYGYLAGLNPSTTYHYQLVATNSAGSTSGDDQSFTTLSAILIDGHFGYTTNAGAITIVAYTGPGGNVTIPGVIAGLPVTSIGEGAFFSIGTPSALTGVTIPNSITNIGDSAFRQCQALTNVIIPDSVTSLGDEAFCACTSLESLTIGNGITIIRGGGGRGMFGTFMGCSSLTRITIPDSVTNIGNGEIHLGGSLGAFYNSGLTNVIIGKGLAYLGTGAFNYCSNLRGVYFQGNAPTTGVSFFGEEDVFHYSDLATVYYLPGTTGWELTLAGVPTVLWNPQMQTSGGSFGVQQNCFEFKIAGTAGIPLVIEACTDLKTQAWSPVQSCTLTNGLIYFSDPVGTNSPARFYRIRSP